MRKTTKILLLILIALTIIIMPQYAVKAAQTVSLEKIEIMSPDTGTYGAEQKIKVALTYTENIQTLATGNATTSDSISYKFGDNGTVRQSEKGILSGKTLTYEVTIQEGDMGKFIITSYNISFLKDGETVSKTENNPEVTGNVITADTTETPTGLTWTDISKMKIETKAEDSNVTRDVYIKISGITEIEGHHYYAFLTNSSTKPEIQLTGSYNAIDTDTITAYLSSFTGNYGYNVKEFYELNTDTYLYIVEEQLNQETSKYENKFIVSNYKITWPERRSLGTRISSYFFSEKTSTFIPELSSERENKGVNVNIKVGKVTDLNILRAIQRGDSDCLSKLLEYAKTTNGIYNGPVLHKEATEAPTITDKFDLVDEAYYYVYMLVDDENGKYYPIEDVSLYQALVGDTVGKNLFDYLDDNFKWNLEDEGTTPPTETPKDDTTLQGKLPQTGQTALIVISCAGLVILTIIFAKKIRKYSI